MLARLIYASTVTDPLRPETLAALLRQARLRNSLRGMTGFLTFDSRHFLQAIEGSPQALNDLYAGILRDPRHRSVTLLKYARIQSRLFPEWQMGFLSSSAAHRALYAPMMTGPAFDPYVLDGEQAESLLLGLAAQAVNADAAIA